MQWLSGGDLNATGQVVQVHDRVTLVNTSPYALLATDVYLACDATALPIVILLTATSGSGREVTIKKIDTSANACTPTRAGTDVIDGATTVSLTKQWAAAKLIDRAPGFWDRAHVNQFGGDVTGVSTANTVQSLNGVLLSGLGTGIVKNTTATGAPSIAVAADIINLFSTCSGTQYLGADGACHTSGGGAAIYSSLGGGAAEDSVSANRLKTFTLNFASLTLTSACQQFPIATWTEPVWMRWRITEATTFVTSNGTTLSMSIGTAAKPNYFMDPVPLFTAAGTTTSDGAAGPTAASGTQTAVLQVCITNTGAPTTLSAALLSAGQITVSAVGMVM
jgi:hypothetical protein